jgi:ankyrin repeat protein
VRSGAKGWYNVYPEEIQDTGGLPLNDLLFTAVEQDNPARALVLLEQLADPNARNRTGWKPLMVAANMGLVTCCAALIKSRADVNAKNSFGGTPLNLGVLRGNVDVLRELCTAKADLNERDQWQETPLHKACSCGWLDAACVMVDFKADVWARNMYGDLAFDLAKARGFRELSDALRVRMDGAPVGVELPYPLPRDAKLLTALTA